MIKEFLYESAERVINDWAKKELDRKNLKVDPQISMFMQLHNHLTKLISNKPRKVSISKSFKISDENKIGFKNLINDLQNGDDVNKYLSKGINKANSPDGLLDYFGCFHFHLGVNTKGEFIERTCELALAIVTESEVFFIETKPHGPKYPYTWSNKSVLEIVHQERPDLIKNNKASILNDISPKVSDQEDIKNLRNNGYGFAVTVDDGTVYMPDKLGPTSNGGLAGVHLIRLMFCTRELYNFINHHLRKFKINKNCTIMHIEVLEYNSLNFSNFNKIKVRIIYLKHFLIYENISSFEK